MSTLVVHHDDCQRHDPGAGHAESIKRLHAVMGGLEGLRGIEKLPAPLATVEQITRVHPFEYWAMLQDSVPGEGRAGLDADTYLNPGSIEATLRAAGATCFAIEQVLSGKAQRAFCAVRPPGHHAEAEVAMGFCLLNNIAIGALQALAHTDVKRVAILDFDVHHGNGTQSIFEANRNVMFVSSHQQPLYPGTGNADEAGCGNVLNLPLAPGDGSAAFRDAWRAAGLPAVHRFDPDLVLVSAGFDAHAADPLAQLELGEADYRWITEEICDLADDCCKGRVVSVLEGGYHLEALANSSRAHVRGLMRAGAR